MVRLAWVNADLEPCPQGAGPLPSLTALASAAHVRYWRIEPATLDHDGGVWERVRRRLSLTTCTRLDNVPSSTPCELPPSAGLVSAYVLSGALDVFVAYQSSWLRISLAENDFLAMPQSAVRSARTASDSNSNTFIALAQEAPAGVSGRGHQPAADGTVNGRPVVLGDAAAAALARYPHARVCGGMIYVSGVSSRRSDNTHVGATLAASGEWILDIRLQTAAVLENIKSILMAADADLSHLVSATVYLVDMKDYSGFNEVWNVYFDAASGPARTTVAVAQLPHPRLLIEILCVAMAPT
ncbi:Endoribonuclease L-PSP [Plasmodiophora brassicae]